MARQFLDYMFCKKIKKNCTTSPSILYSFSSALLQLARHRVSAIPPFPAVKLHSHEQATALRHHPRHGHATLPCPYCDWPLNGETLGTRREKAERTHLTNAEADRRGRASACGGGPHEVNGARLSAAARGEARAPVSRRRARGRREKGRRCSTRKKRRGSICARHWRLYTREIYSRCQPPAGSKGW